MAAFEAMYPMSDAAMSALEAGYGPAAGTTVAEAYPFMVGGAVVSAEVAMAAFAAGATVLAPIALITLLTRDIGSKGPDASLEGWDGSGEKDEYFGTPKKDLPDPDLGSGGNDKSFYGPVVETDDDKDMMIIDDVQRRPEPEKDPDEGVHTPDVPDPDVIPGVLPGGLGKSVHRGVAFDPDSLFFRPKNMSRPRVRYINR